MSERIREILETRLQYKGTAGRDTNYDCPFCAESGHTLHVNYHKGEHGMARCHTCWYGTRSLLHLVRDLFGYIPKSLRSLAGHSPLVFDIDKLFKSSAAQPVPLPDDFSKLPERPTDNVTRIMLKYLQLRGFTYNDIDVFGIGYAPSLRGFLIFPFWQGGRVVYWQGRRVFGNSEAKNHNPPSTGKKSYLFGYQQAVGQKTGFICEGPLDGIAWGPGGLPLTSKDLHPQQVNALRLLGFDDLIVCLDSTEHDKTRQYAYRLNRELSCRVGYLLLPSGDPADNKKRLRLMAAKNTVWLKRGVESEVEWRLRKTESRGARKVPTITGSMEKAVREMNSPIR